MAAAAVSGEDVKAFRARKGLTQYQLAEATGFTESYVCKVEQGDRGVSDDFAEALRVVEDGPLGLSLIVERAMAQMEHGAQLLREATEILRDNRETLAKVARLAERQARATPETPDRRSRSDGGKS